MGFLLEKLKETFETEDEEESEGFRDINCVVGNTSGMDVTQQIPSDLAERVGQLAQRGGSTMEIKIENPSSFFIDRENLYDVVEGLGIDVSFHSDPNVGYTSAYREGQGRGFYPTQEYFHKYLEAFASFKKEKEVRDQYSFNIDRINPHVSTDQLPSLEERMAQDIGLDPFGYNIAEFKEEIVNEKNHKGKNIYANPEFMRRFYRLFVVEELGDNEYRYFQNFYTSISPHFDKIWREKQNDVANQMYRDRVGENGSRVKDKIDLITTASMRENITNEWLDILEETEFEEPVEITDDDIRNIVERRTDLRDSLSTLEDLDKLISSLSQRFRLSQLRTLPEIYYFLAEQKMERMLGQTTNQQIDDGIDEDFQKNLWAAFENVLPDAIDKLWFAPPREENKDTKAALISVQGKITAMVREMEIPDDRVQEKTFEIHKEELREEIESMFSGEEPKFFEDPESSDDIHWKEKHRRFLQSFARNFEQQMWSESNIFYKIIPAWMASSDYSGEGHDGFVAPKFIWKYLVERKWADRKNVELDLKDPRTPNGSDTRRYFDLLEDSNEFQMDVAAAVGAVYMWSHFTQIENRFSIGENSEYVEPDSGHYTWIEWMNKYGIGVNMEAMYGGPNQLFKLWRSKDIVAACRAINITARRKFGAENIHPSLDECPLKFTIDMEHVSSFGIDPLEEDMMELVKHEKDLMENPISVGEEEVYTPGFADKPLAKMVRMYHLTKPGHETSQGVGHIHGPFSKGDTELYEWLYRMVEKGFGRNPGEEAYVMYEVGGDQRGTVYQAKLSMDMIEIGIDPGELDPSAVDPGKDPKTRKGALMARFFDMDRANFSREWAKIENNAFAPLRGLMEAKQFDYTHTGTGATEEGELRPQEYPQEEYK